MSKPSKKPPKRLSNRKKAAKMIAATTKAKLEAEMKVEESMLKKHPLLYLKRFAEAHLKDIPDIIAMVGTTYLVHTVILNSPELKNKAAAYMVGLGTMGALGVTIAGVADILIPRSAAKPLDDDWHYWLVSFVVAFLIVRYGGQMLTTLEGGISGITKVAGALLA